MIINVHKRELYYDVLIWSLGKNIVITMDAYHAYYGDEYGYSLHRLKYVVLPFIDVPLEGIQLAPVPRKVKT